MPRLAELASMMQLFQLALPKQGRRIIALNELHFMAALLAAVGLVVTLVGVYMWLSTRFPMEEAVLIMGGVLLATSFLLVLAAVAISHWVRRPFEDAANNLATQSSDMLKLILSELDQPIKENPLLAVSAAALTGYVAGEKTMNGKPN